MRTWVSTAAILAAALVPGVAHAAEAAGEQGRGSWLALLYYVANFLIFAWVLYRYAGPMVRSFFGERAGSIRATRERAETLASEAEARASQAAERLARLADEKAKLGADLGAESALEATRIREASRTAATRVLRDAELEAAALGEAAQRRLRGALAAAAAGLARELLAQHFQRADQQRMVEEFAARLADEGIDDEP